MKTTIDKERICSCPKQVLGRGWDEAGKWHEGRLCAPRNHNEACALFEDNSHASFDQLCDQGDANIW